MPTQSQVCSHDSLRAFCEDYISGNRENWPTSESKLASAFLKHFRIPFLLHIRDLGGFLIQTSIEIIEGDLPRDLLAVNMSFEGKRRISLSHRVEYRPFQVHTVLHEIREMIENDFYCLGFSTAESQRDLEARADEFAFEAFVCACADPLKRTLENVLEMESTTWRKWAQVGLIAIGVIACFVWSFYGAFYVRLERAALNGN